nr:mannitol dehydrogenase family protein [Maliibacterium massiliense]
MKLNDQGLQNRAPWLEKGFELPNYDIAQMRARTKENPTWVHFGAGNIFRAFTAALQQTLLNQGAYDRGIVVCEGFDTEIIERAYAPFDNLSLLVVLKADGSIEKKVIASVAESLRADASFAEDWQALKGIFENPSLQMASFTITEKGYNIWQQDGSFLPAVAQDMAAGVDAPSNIIGKVTALCYARYQENAAPLALVSMDNCSHNGEKLAAAVMAYVENWTQAGLVDAGFAAYMQQKVSFPWSMIDKITPRPDANVQRMLQQDGFEDTEIIHTARNTYTAAFVNAEETQYLVIEDDFPAGRPPLEKAGVIFTDRDTVNRVEKMKVCTCLNPLHTALAVFGCLLSYDTIANEMKDPELVKLVRGIGYDEGMPVVVNPGIIDPKTFIDEVIGVRFPNPFMPDTPQRIATDTSQKLPVRYGETLKAYQHREDLDMRNLKLIPLVFAGWCRYLMGVNDAGEPFELSADPLYDEVAPCVRDIKLGDTGPFRDALKPILSNKNIFGLNLYRIGMANTVLQYFTEMVAGPGAVRETLKKYTK